MNRSLHAALAALALACCAQAQAAVTYEYRSTVYETVRNFTGPCNVANTCYPLNLGTRVQGMFTSAAMLPPNIDMSLPGKVLPHLTGWDFTNGSLSILSTSPGARVNKFQLHTDGTGMPDHSAIVVSQWVDGSAGPHAVGDRVNVIVANTLSWDAANQNYTVTNAECTHIGTSAEGVADTCLAWGEPLQTSSRATYTSGALSLMGLPLVTISSASLPEGNAGSAAFLLTVSLSRAPDAPVSVDWRTVDDMATAPSDFTAASGTLTWAAGESGAKTIPIQVHGDTAPEADETFFVQLENLVGVAGGASTRGIGTILNDDMPPVPPTVSISHASVQEGDSGAASMSFIVTLSAPPLFGVSVDWVTADGSATAPSDYRQDAGTLHWGAGDATPRTISVLVQGDTAAEPDEQFSVALRTPSGVVLSPDQREGVGTIVNDDSGALPPPGGTVQHVPTLADWVLLALSALLLCFGTVLLKRMQR